jgi:hypothetical protein
MQKRIKWLWQTLVAVAVAVALGFGVQTATAGQGTSPCNPYPTADTSMEGWRNTSWCEHAACDACCQSEFGENGECNPPDWAPEPNMNHCLCFPS